MTVLGSAVRKGYSRPEKSARIQTRKRRGKHYLNLAQGRKLSKLDSRQARRKPFTAVVSRLRVLT
jgi:hypothetical protein